MQGGGEMATRLRRDGMHVSGNAAATTTKPTHTITTVIAAAAAERRAAGQECSMADISTPPTCTAVVRCAHACGAVGALSRRALETKTDRGGVSESRIRLFHLRHDMYVLQITRTRGPPTIIISACWHDFDNFTIIMTIIIA